MGPLELNNPINIWYNSFIQHSLIYPLPLLLCFTLFSICSRSNNFVLEEILLLHHLEFCFELSYTSVVCRWLCWLLHFPSSLYFVKEIYRVFFWGYAFCFLQFYLLQDIVLFGLLFCCLILWPLYLLLGKPVCFTSTSYWHWLLSFQLFKNMCFISYFLSFCCSHMRRLIFLELHME